RISSFIERAGGLTEFAYIRGAKLLREMTKEEKERTYAALLAKATVEKDSSIIANLDYKAQPVGIDLEAALRNPGSDKDLILKAGDVLTIPQYIATVKISGAVMYPNTVIYDQNKTLRQYIKQAGGFSRLAMKRKPYVIYLNGQVATGSTAKIEPGCEIVVPERPEREPVSLQNILGVTTALASLALIISRFF
ncbi:MAG: SLBB domain-containing protein, partial [Phocaeicola sp.]|nr:SLBB domain-containing protein [Phocaeicola sp.]